MAPRCPICGQPPTVATATVITQRQWAHLCKRVGRTVWWNRSEFASGRTIPAHRAG